MRKLLMLLFFVPVWGEQISNERKDNVYVKGFYGHGYSSQRYSHIDYILNEYDASDRELGEHIEDYIDDCCCDEDL